MGTITLRMRVAALLACVLAALVAKTSGSLGDGIFRPLLYHNQGQYAKAEIYQRALAIYEKALGPEQPDVATSLENYGLPVRKHGPAGKKPRSWSLAPWQLGPTCIGPVTRCRVLVPKPRI
jgi:tetratricopeptide repeat protein